MNATTDWHAWHDSYRDAASPLSRRLRLIQRHVGAWLDARTDQRLVVVSVCAGQGRDVLGVLAARPDAARVHVHLFENDERNVAAARATVAARSIPNVAVHQTDAGDPGAYAGAVPADLVLLAGVFGNVSDGDVRQTVTRLPELCAPSATVIWTRARRAPDLTPAVRRWFTASGFVERAFTAPDDALFTVGVHELAGSPRTLRPSGRLFTFVA